MNTIKPIKPIRKNKRINSPGIYQIEASNGKLYIGSATNLSERTMGNHTRDLIRGKHHNQHLQNHVNKYGIKDLLFDVLEFCHDKTKLIEREQYYIDALKPEFNICKKAGSVMAGRNHTEKTKQKISKANKGSKRTKEQRQKFSAAQIGKHSGPHKRKETYQFDLDGNFIAKYKNRQEASKQTGVRASAINASIVNIFSATHTFIWANNSDNILKKVKLFKKYVKNNQTCRLTYQFDLDGNFIAKYKSMAEASRQTGIVAGIINSCMQKTTCHAGGFIFTDGEKPSIQQMKDANKINIVHKYWDERKKLETKFNRI